MLLMNFAKLFFKKKCIQIYLIFVFLATLIYLLNPYNALDTNFKNAYFRNKLSCLFHDKQANTKLVYKYSSQSKHSPLILVGGSGRSGTTLMRTILDAHPDVNCGPESRIIPDLLEVFKRFEYDEAKNETLDNALSSFIHHLLSTRTTKSSRLCAKDPSVVYFINYALRIFPSAKFVYMIRDGRDVAFSMMKRFKKDFDFKHMKKNLKEWNRLNSAANRQCMESRQSCIRVKYEDFIREPKENMMRVANFLNLTWTDDFLRHNELIGSKIVVMDAEWSADQVKKPIYTSSVHNWVGKIENYDKNEVRNDFFMLKEFGYDLELE
jgi:protein-tyrosine sulfotransferase